MEVEGEGPPQRENSDRGGQDSCTQNFSHTHRVPPPIFRLVKSGGEVKL